MKIKTKAWVALTIAVLSGLPPGCRQQAAKPRTPASPTQTVAVTIDFGDGRQRKFEKLPWSDGLTVLEALQSAAETPQGPKIEARGSGPSGFVEGIDSVRNSKGGPNNRNWLFYVNGKKGAEGADLTTLRPGDRVLWKYETGL